MEIKELIIISHLRQDARENLTRISKDTGIPVSTLFDKLKKYKGNIIKKHTSLIDFRRIGYDVHVQIMLKSRDNNKETLEKFLMSNMHVNSCYKINNGFDFMVELIFRNMNDYYNFSEKLENYSTYKNEFFLLKELKHEDFLNDSTMIELL